MTRRTKGANSRPVPTATWKPLCAPSDLRVSVASLVPGSEPPFPKSHAFNGRLPNPTSDATLYPRSMGGRMLRRQFVVLLPVMATLALAATPVPGQSQQTQAADFKPFVGDWQGWSNYNHEVRFVVPPNGASPQYYYNKTQSNFEWIKVQNGSVVFRLRSGQATITPDGTGKMNIAFTPDRESWVMKAVLAKK